MESEIEALRALAGGGEEAPGCVPQLFEVVQASKAPNPNPNPKGGASFQGADAGDGVRAWWFPLAARTAGSQHQSDSGARIRGAPREWNRVLPQSGSSSSVARTVSRMLCRLSSCGAAEI